MNWLLELIIYVIKFASILKKNVFNQNLKTVYKMLILFKKLMLLIMWFNRKFKNLTIKLNYLFCKFIEKNEIENVKIKNVFNISRNDSWNWNNH